MSSYLEQSCVHEKTQLTEGKDTSLATVTLAFKDMGSQEP